MALGMTGRLGLLLRLRGGVPSTCYRQKQVNDPSVMRAVPETGKGPADTCDEGGLLTGLACQLAITANIASGYKKRNENWEHLSAHD